MKHVFPLNSMEILLIHTGLSNTAMIFSYLPQCSVDSISKNALLLGYYFKLLNIARQQAYYFSHNTLAHIHIQIQKLLLMLSRLLLLAQHTRAHWHSFAFSVTFSILIDFHNACLFASNVYSIEDDIAEIRNFCQIIDNNISELETMDTRAVYCVCVHIFFYSLACCTSTSYMHICDWSLGCEQKKKMTESNSYSLNMLYRITFWSCGIRRVSLIL